GRELFAALLPPGSKLLDGYTIAANPPKRLRLRLHLAETAPAELHALRWERLLDPRRDMPVSCLHDVIFSRSCAVPEIPGEPVEVVPRLLVALANPSDHAENDLPAPDSDASPEAVAEFLRLSGLNVEILAGPVTVG